MAKRSLKKMMLVPPTVMTDSISNLARAGLVFHPRLVAYLNGCPADQVRLHCELMTSAHLLWAVHRGREIWFRQALPRQLEMRLALPAEVADGE